MATKLAGNSGPHTAGIFADMTVDGPEIGTLVLVVDRAKNLPSKKTMGKQSPYAAARLGKEAKKTETDKRGGQTPKWDQELRFTVHDSPDYDNLKLSVFSEDKRTDLVGEAWVSLSEVIVRGGGKNDLWQGLNCKGKYAGEVRIELTYYDSRPKPEKSEEDVNMRQSSGKVKRRPLPTNPNSGSVTPDSIPGLEAPGRAKHGPRDYRTPPRATSMPPDTMGFHHSQMHSLYGNQPLAHDTSLGDLPAAPTQQTHLTQFHDEPQQYSDQQPLDDPYEQPDFLPQLPPTNRQRTAAHQRYASAQVQPAPLQPRPFSHIGLPHSHSAPIVPMQQPEPESFDQGHLSMDLPEPIPDVDYQHRQLRQRRADAPPGWQADYSDAYAQAQSPIDEPNSAAPPPPPVHSNSAPVVPHATPSPSARYAGTPPHTRHQSIPNASPLQRVERGYGQPRHTPPHGHPARGRSMDDYGVPLENSPYGRTPPSLVPGQPPSPYSPSHGSPPARGLPHRHSVADAYGGTPPRPHPLSQEVPRARSPLPEVPQMYEHSQYQSQNGLPVMRPRPLSPQPPPSVPQSRSPYSLQHPIRAHESSNGSPLSTSHSNPRMTIQRKPSPQPSPINTGSPGVPFGPDSFDVHNPYARPSPLASSPHTPYQVEQGAEAERKGPIVGWHGQEIDPSDHLPVDSWAPEPAKKTPTKTYGLGRDRDFGPRTVQSAGAASSGGRLSKDTVVNFRTKNTPEPESFPSSPGRNRLVKNGGGGRSPGPEPLREHQNFNSVPNPYVQQDYSRHGGFGNGSPGGYAGSAYGVPNVPPKLPMHSQEDALAMEINSIDIGSGRYGRPTNSSVPPPTAYVPVRSHRERRSWYGE